MDLIDISKLSSACSTFGVPIPDAMLEAERLITATAELAASIRRETEPDIDSLSADTLADLHAAIVAWPSRGTRLATAERLAAAADSRLADAWWRYSPELLEQFRKPFDTAAAASLNGKPEAYTAMQQLAGVRDVLANACTRAACRSDLIESTTRLITPPNTDTAVNRLRHRISGLERFTPEWCAAVRGTGCVIEWHTPTDQERIDQDLRKPPAADALAA